MSVERTIYCDNATCGERRPGGESESRVHATTAAPPPYLPAGFIGVEWWDGTPDQPHRLQFCGWDCLMAHASTYPPEEIVA